MIRPRSSDNREKIYASVVIPTFHRRVYALEALYSIVIQETGFSFEVLVMDNGMDSYLEQELQRASPALAANVKYYPVREIGLHNGRNLGAKKAQGEIVVFVDDDILAPPGWLASLCAPFKDASIAGVGGRTTAIWEGNKPDWIDALPPSYFSLLGLGDKNRFMEWPETPYGCNMAYRRSLILELGGFSPDGMGGGWIEWKRGDGETGFAKKVYDSGHEVLYSVEGWLYHRIPQHRMTRAFVRSRTMKSALTSFYMEMRSARYGRKVLIRLGINNSLKFLQYMAIKLPRSFKPINQWVTYDIAAWHHLFTALYQLRLAFDRGLRSWVAKENYWIREK